MNVRNFLPSLLIILAGGWHAVPVQAQSCTPIYSVPYSISSPGKYCLTQNLRYEGGDTAISISSDDVVLDFNGYTLQGGAAAAANSFSRGVLGIYRSNVTVRNGAIRKFGYGVQFTQQSGGASIGLLIEQMLVDGVSTTGMQIDGTNAVIRGNRISNVTTTNSNGLAYAILVFGSGARIIDNVVARVNSPAFPVGIWIAASGSVVQGNFVSELGVSTNGLSGYGIYVNPNVTSGIIENNHVSQSVVLAGTGIGVSSNVTNIVVEKNTVIGYRAGINLSGSTGSKIRNNTVNVVGVAYYGGINLGGNN
jgi:parallel beta-helix repeat protein